MKTTTVNLLRHGAVQGKNCYRGITDSPLDLKGWQQMSQAIGRLHNIDYIISSPLRRCLDFAEDYALKKQLPLQIVNAFSEINFGDWEGKTADEISHSHPGALLKFYQDPGLPAPGSGESLQNFSQRTVNAWQEILQIHRGKQILLITHAGVIRTLLAHALGTPTPNTFTINISHACLSQLQCLHSDTEDFIQLTSHYNPFAQSV